MESFCRQFQSWILKNVGVPVLPLCIVGNIGVGKSTFVHSVKEATRRFTDIVVVTEPIDEFAMIFNRFCASPATAANWQIANLNHFSSVMIQYVEKAKATNKQFVVVFERSPFCCRDVFFPLQRDLADRRMCAIVDIMAPAVCNSTGWKSAFVVCLEFTDTMKAMKRIASRGRDGEEGITPDYWNAINEKYRLMMKSLNASHSTLVVDVTDFGIEQVYHAANVVGSYIDEWMPSADPSTPSIKMIV